jgi:oxygen-independent coproporphyrinogen III oxidase
MSDLGLYVHLPFCRRRCTYCAFAISVDRGRERAYVDALIREVELAGRVGAAPVTSLFYGGGTPSLTAGSDLRRIGVAIRNTFDVTPGAETTLEANPEDVTEESLDLWVEAGVNRISLGVQSLVDSELYPLGRGHGRAAALEALRRARAVPGLRLSADLILGLPGQTGATFEQSLAESVEAGAGHLSLYMLDLEEGSALRRQVEIGRTKLPEDAATAEAYERAIETAGTAGLVQYEISNFARPGEESVHNLRYWQRKPYLGVGLAAHSFAGRERWANAREMDEYIRLMESDGSAVVFRETLTDQEVREEEIFLSLRQTSGLRYSDLVRLCGPEGQTWVEQGLGEGWLVCRGESVAFTPTGFLLSNEHIARLFSSRC